ncbi:MAG: PH domain-containing protein [Thermoleophilia bacterium]|nr:PH domain-containing protein [Thermoleophilia bacterium]
MAEILEGETLIWEGRPTWKWSISFLLKWSLVGVLLNRVVEVPVSWFFAVSMIFIAVVVVLAWIKRLDSHYMVTNRRVVVRRGITNRNERSASIERIQNVNTKQGLYGRVLNFGDIEFDTAGSDISDSDLALRGISDPHNMRDTFDRELLQRGGTSGGV